MFWLGMEGGCEIGDAVLVSAVLPSRPRLSRVAPARLLPAFGIGKAAELLAVTASWLLKFSTAQMWGLFPFHRGKKAAEQFQLPHSTKAWLWD